MSRWFGEYGTLRLEVPLIVIHLHRLMVYLLTWTVGTTLKFLYRRQWLLMHLFVVRHALLLVI